jgi:hypothetical protein
LLARDGGSTALRTVCLPYPDSSSLVTRKLTKHAVALLGWANQMLWSGLYDYKTRFPNVAAWYERCRARPATARGLAIPSQASGSIPMLTKRLEQGEEGLAEREEFAKKFLAAAKLQYGYQYKSP